MLTKAYKVILKDPDSAIQEKDFEKRTITGSNKKKGYEFYTNQIQASGAADMQVYDERVQFNIDLMKNPDNIPDKVKDILKGHKGNLSFKKLDDMKQELIKIGFVIDYDVDIDGNPLSQGFSFTTLRAIEFDKSYTKEPYIVETLIDIDNIQDQSFTYDKRIKKDSCLDAIRDGHKLYVFDEKNIAINKVIKLSSHMIKKDKYVKDDTVLAIRDYFLNKTNYTETAKEITDKLDLCQKDKFKKGDLIDIFVKGRNKHFNKGHNMRLICNEIENQQKGFFAQKDNIDICNDLKSLGVSIDYDSIISKGNIETFGIKKDPNNTIKLARDFEITTKYLKENFPNNPPLFTQFNDAINISLDKENKALGTFFEHQQPITVYGNRNAIFIKHNKEKGTAESGKALIQYENSDSKEYVNYDNIQKRITPTMVHASITNFIDKVNMGSNMGGSITYEYKGKTEENDETIYNFDNVSRKLLTDNENWEIKGTQEEICSQFFKNDTICQYDYVTTKLNNAQANTANFKIGILTNNKVRFFDDTAKELANSHKLPLELKQDRVCLTLNQKQLNNNFDIKNDNLFIIKGFDELELKPFLRHHEKIKILDAISHISQTQKPENSYTAKIREVLNEAVKTGHVHQASHTQFAITKKGVCELIDHTKQVEGISLASIKKEYGGGIGIFSKLKFSNGNVHDFKMKASKDDLAIIDSASHLKTQERRKILASVISKRMQFGFKAIPEMATTKQNKTESKNNLKL